MSVPEIQLNLSAVLRIKQGRFEVVDRGGRFILKPSSLDYPALAQPTDNGLEIGFWTEYLLAA